MFIKGSSDTKILSFLLMIFFISVITFILFKIKNKNKNHKYYKDWTTREEILKQSQLLTVDDVEFIKNSTLLTLKEKKDIIIDIYSKDGFTVNNISVTQMQFRKEKTFSLFWAILWLCLFLVGLLVYIFYYMSKSDDIGGGTTEIGVTSLGGLVLCKSIKVAGDKFDKSIIEYVRQNYNLFIGERTAENIKIEIGTAIKLDSELKMKVKGRDNSGLLSTIELGSEGVRIAIKEPLKEIVSAIKSVLENMPPDLASDIVDNGVIITGGGALIRGLDVYLSDIIKLPVKIADEPLLSVAYGTSQVLDEPELLKLITNA
jgi:hypothetical protein